MKIQAPAAPATPARAVGVVGVGLMGGAMAARLVATGWRVCVHDIHPGRMAEAEAAGAEPCASAQAVVQHLPPTAPLVVVVVDAAQVADVLFGATGAAQAMAPGQTVVLCPTIGPGDTEALGARLEALGLGCVDAPISGGPLRAREGRMSMMVAGPEPAVGALTPLLQDLSTQVFQVGSRIGDGARTKLVNNLLAGINLVGAAEAMVLAERLGLDPALTLAVVERSSGQSWIGSDRLARALAGDHTPRAHMTLLSKDTRLAMAAAGQVGVQGPLGAATAAAFAQACAAGYADHDDGALLQWLRQLPTMRP